MRAVFKHNGTERFVPVQLGLREDGTSGPPYRIKLTYSPCCSTPPVTLRLELERCERDTATYRVIQIGERNEDASEDLGDGKPSTPPLGLKL